MSQSFLKFPRTLVFYIRNIGLGKVLEILVNFVDNILQKLNWPPLHVEVGGFSIHGYLRHTRYLGLIMGKEHESYSLKICESFLKPGSYFIDGGAHIGLYSLFASRWVGSNGKVIAFEPDPYNYAALKYNLRKNNIKNVLVIPKALTNTKGNQYFYMGKTTLSSSLIQRTDVEQQKRVSTDCTTLDNEMTNEIKNIQSKPTFMKLDLEGAEPYALQGMTYILNRLSSVAMLIEINPTALANAGFLPQDIISPLIKLGFQIEYVDETGEKFLPIEPPITEFKGNLYCVKGLSTQLPN